MDVAERVQLQVDPERVEADDRPEDGRGDQDVLDSARLEESLQAGRVEGGHGRSGAGVSVADTAGAASAVGLGATGTASLASRYRHAPMRITAA